MAQADTSSSAVGGTASEQDTNKILGKLLDLLTKVPDHDRVRFASSQLTHKYPALVQAFAAIPPQNRDRCVLYFAPTPHSREVRIAKAARLSGLIPFLLTSATPKYRTSDVFNFHAIIEDPVLAVLATWIFPGALVHGFALRGDHLFLLSRLKPHRLVVDLYDTAAGTFDLASPEALAEKAVIESADGVTHRDLRIKHLQRFHGYRLPKQNLFITDPLSHAPTAAASSQKNGTIDIVSTGWIGTGANSILRVAAGLCRGSVHLHVYFNPFQTAEHADTAEYYRLQKENRNFHIHPAVYGEAYWSELSRYHFGLSVLEPDIFGEPVTGYTTEAMKACGSSRVTDYINAGLGVISSPLLRFQFALATRYAPCVVRATRELLADPEQELRQALAARRSKSTRSISCEGVAHRLKVFYTNVAAPAA